MWKVFFRKIRVGEGSLKEERRKGSFVGREEIRLGVEKEKGNVS